MKFCNYDTHEAADIMPMMEPDEYVELKADIERHGLLQPLVVFEGKILDGRNRAKVCDELGIKPRTVLWSDNGASPCGGSPIQWVLSTNAIRRHLTPSQRGAIALQSLPLLEAEAKARMLAGTPVPKLEHGRSIEKAAKAVGVSKGYVADAKKIKEQSPYMFEKLKSGEVTLQDAKRTLHLTASVPKPADKMPEDEDSDKLWTVKRYWRLLTKKDKRKFLEWMKTVDEPQGKQKPILA